MNAITYQCYVAFATLTLSFISPALAESNPNDFCPGVAFVSNGFLYECNDAQAVLIGCADSQDAPIKVGQRWHAKAGAFPNGTVWGFSMACERIDENKVANIPVACYVNEIEIDVDDTINHNGTLYQCERKESGKLILTFSPACQGDQENCDTTH